MPTIRVNTVPVPMELEVTTTSDQIINAFDTSLNEVIERTVRDHVANGLASMVMEPAYVCSVRDWVMESLDYSYMSELVSRRFPVRDIVEELVENYGSDNPFQSEQFLEGLARNSKFQMVMQRFVQEYLQVSSNFSQLIDAAVAKQTANLANEVADKVLTIISQRLNGGADV